MSTPQNDESRPLFANEEGSGSHSQDEFTSATHQYGWRDKMSSWRLVLVLTPCNILVTSIVILLGLGSLSFFSYRAVHKHVEAEDSNRVGRLPAMGFNTWNAYHCDINENLVLEAAQLLTSLGLKDAGYSYVNIDDCYSEKVRDNAGNIVANKERFPSGMRKLTDHVHSLGFKAGIYSDSGWQTCALYPGSFQNEYRDAKLFQVEWGFDYLKYDNCAVPFDEVIKEGMVGKFMRMANAISNVSAETGKPPLVYSLCQWGRNPGSGPGDLVKVGGLRMTLPNWRSVAKIINQNSFWSWASDFYGYNDMDMLEIGNGDLDYEESKTHFTAWALMKSPLLIGTHLPSISQQSLEILKNKELIAINQDPVIGTAVTPFKWGINPDWTFNSTHPAQYWSGDSQNGTVFMLINVLDHPADLFFQLTDSPWIRAGRQYHVKDLWTHTDNGTAVRNFTAHQVPAHGVVALLLTDAGDEPAGTQPPCAQPEWCQDQNGTRIDRN